MSPLAPAGTRGYTDGQRVQNWDSPILYTDSLAAVPVNTGGFPLDVGRYGYLAGYDGCSGGDVQAWFRWYTDANGANLAGVRFFNLSSNVANVAQYRIPNLGPFVKIQWTSLSGAGPTHSSQIFGTNRVHPLEFIPQQGLIVDSQSVNVGALAQEIVYPTDYYAGPASVYVFSTQVGIFFLDALNSLDVWERIADWAVVASTRQYQTFTFPPGAWRVRLLNSSSTTAATVSIIITPPTTGAV